MAVLVIFLGWGMIVIEMYLCPCGRGYGGKSCCTLLFFGMLHTNKVVKSATFKGILGEIIVLGI